MDLKHFEASSEVGLEMEVMRATTFVEGFDETNAGRDNVLLALRDDRTAVENILERWDDQVTFSRRYF
jgi:hypothetical protein